MTKIEPSSGNVFQDLGLENADELLEKSKIAIEIRRAMDSFNHWMERSFNRFTIDELKMIRNAAKRFKYGIESVWSRIENES